MYSLITMIKDFADLARLSIDFRRNMNLLNDKLIEVRRMDVELMVLVQSGSAEVFEHIEKKEKAIHNLLCVIPHLNESVEKYDDKFRQIHTNLNKLA